MYIYNVKNENHNVATIIPNVAPQKQENIQNIASIIMNGDIVNGNIVDASIISRLGVVGASIQTELWFIDLVNNFLSPLLPWFPCLLSAAAQVAPIRQKPNRGGPTAEPRPGQPRNKNLPTDRLSIAQTKILPDCHSYFFRFWKITDNVLFW